MACKTSYELHHHFPRLAEESGFTFNTHRPRVHIDWNKISNFLYFHTFKPPTCLLAYLGTMVLIAKLLFSELIDVENLIRERKFVLIEQHLNDVRKYYIIT